jgi:Ca-activated chloride channel family protein
MKASAFLVAALLPTLAGQQDPARFKAETKMVRLLVNVKDAKGELVGSLEKSDFTVYDCGVKQEVDSFERQTAMPLSISVLIDVSGSTLKDIRYETTSIEKFFKALLNSGNMKDAAAVYSFNDSVTLLKSFTRNQGQLSGSMRNLNPVGSTALYDAIVFAAEGLNNREGRHVVVIVTDGGDTGSKYRYGDARREAHLADAVVYPIVVVPITNDAGRNTGGENALALMAKDTGGRTFYPSVGAQLDQTFAEILKDLRRTYLLAYYPHELPKDAPEFHPVQVEMSRSDLRPSTRTGYYGDAGR